MVRAEALTPADLWAIVWRYRLPAIVAAVVCAAAAYGYSLTLPDAYTATTLVLVQDESVSTSFVRSPVTVDLEARLRTMRDKVLSRTSLQLIMDRFGLFTQESSWERRLSSMRGRIDVEVSRTDAFRISFTHTDPTVSRDVTNALATLFIDDSRQAAARQSQGTTALLDQRLTDIDAQLAVKERELSDFKARHMGALPEQLSSTVSALDSAKQQLSTVRADLAAARDRRSRLESEVGSATPALRSDISPARQAAIQLLADTGEADLPRKIAAQPAAVRLEALRLWRESLLRSFTARHPDVQRVELEIAALERQGVTAGAGSTAGTDSLATDLGTLMARQLDDAQREIRIHEQRRSELDAQIADLQARIQAAPGVERDYLELTRSHSALEKAYDELQSRRMEASISGNMDVAETAGFRVLDPAVTPQTKSSPRRAFWFLAGGLFGCALVIGGGAAREIVLQPLHDSDELERHMGVPVLGAIPAIDNAARRRQQVLVRGVGVAIVVTVLAGVFLLRMWN